MTRRPESTAAAPPPQPEANGADWVARLRAAGFAGPTIGWFLEDHLDAASNAAMALAPNVAVTRKIDIALSNSFGFGGTNASLVLGKVRG